MGIYAQDKIITIFISKDHCKHQMYFDTFSTEFCYIPSYCTLGAFLRYKNFTPSALSARTVAIMAHNKGLELGAYMVLLWGVGVLLQK